MRKAILLVTAAAVAVIPASVPAQYAQPLDPRYVAEAQRDHPKLVAEFGGAETGPRAAYVESVGRRVAAYSGVANPGAAYRFTVLNSAVENAFTVPGGYVYITRQLLGIMEDESQLAFALGHEVGHVAARHAQQRQAAARRNSIGSIFGVLLGSVLGGSLGNSIAQQSQVGAQLRTLGFSREQEHQSDTLGIRYLINAGYDPAGAAGVLSAIARASALQARVHGLDNRQLPEWASTHPLTTNRVQRTTVEARRTGRVGTGTRNRDQFLNAIEGVYVDDDPEQGVIDGRTFTHPDLRLQFTVPTGYLMQNGTDAVTIAGSAGKAQFSTGRYNGNLDTYIGAVLQSLTGGRTQLQVLDRNRTTVNGLPTSYVVARANTSSGAVDVSVFAYAFSPTQAYHFVMLTQGGRGVGPFGAMVNSLRRISTAEASAIRPRVIDVVTVRQGDTMQSLAARMAYRDFQLDRFLSLNGLPAQARLTPGQRVKLVVYGTRTR